MNGLVRNIKIHCFLNEFYHCNSRYVPEAQKRTGKTVDMFLGEICVQVQGMSINLISSFRGFPLSGQKSARGSGSPFSRFREHIERKVVNIRRLFGRLCV